jgi:hypothetical protein
MPYYILKSEIGKKSSINTKEKKKVCKLDSCTGGVYAKGLCQYHYKISIWKPMKSRTKKRSKEEKEYLLNRSKFIESKRDKNGKIYCIFCNKEISQDPDLHHGLGREELLLLNQEHWFLSHSFCHARQYHSMSWRDIPWWQDYIERVKIIDPEVYKQDLRRMEK